MAGWTFAAAYRAAREVGGDLYDVFPLRGRPQLVGLLVADVTGKGIPAALLTPRRTTPTGPPTPSGA